MNELEQAVHRAQQTLYFSEFTSAAEIINWLLQDRHEWIEATKAANQRFKQAEQRLWELKDRG